MDRLRRSHFLDELGGKVFLTQYGAWTDLTGDGTTRAA
jgi:SulP family sulfate permease